MFIFFQPMAVHQDTISRMECAQLVLLASSPQSPTVFPVLSVWLAHTPIPQLLLSAQTACQEHILDLDLCYVVHVSLDHIQGHQKVQHVCHVTKGTIQTRLLN